MKYKDKSTKIGAYKWIWIANKFAKFHPKRLNRSENIPKSFFFGGRATFLKHPVHAFTTRAHSLMILNQRRQ